MKAVAVGEGNLRADVAEEILVRRACENSVNGPEMKFAGTPTSYTVSVANLAMLRRKTSRWRRSYPRTKFLSSTGGQFVENENKVSWTLPNLRPTAEQEVEFKCTLATPGPNRVQVLAAAAGDLSDSASVTTNVEALADLKLEVVDPSGPSAVGEDLVYEVHIRNRGTKAAENVEVGNVLSNGIEPISAQGAGTILIPAR